MLNTIEFLLQLNAYDILIIYWKLRFLVQNPNCPIPDRFEWNKNIFLWKWEIVAIEATKVRNELGQVYAPE